MSGAKGAKLIARKLLGAPKKHYCPTCMEKNPGVSTDNEANPVMVIPGRKIVFVCKANHRWHHGQTVLL
jgi:hypothetical protein